MSVFIIHKFYTEHWLKRAERSDCKIDIYDKFISLWIAFNSWMKGIFGEIDRERDLIERVKSNIKLREVFNSLRAKNDDFLKHLDTFKEYEILNLRPRNENERTIKYTCSFSSLIETIYLIRNNLFHGRKGSDPNTLDDTVVTLAYNILLPLFKEIYSNYKNGFD